MEKSAKVNHNDGDVQTDGRGDFLANCEKFSSSSNQSYNKEVNEKPPKPQSFECELCNYQTTDELELKNHATSHEELSLQHNCGHCSYSSSSQENLKSHVIRMHAGENELHCPQCGSSYNTENQLSRHTKIGHSKREQRVGT